MTGPGPARAVELAPGVSVDPADLRYAFSRAGGPGGQAVNKLSTRVQLRVAVEAIEGMSGAARNRLRALAGRRLTRDDELVLVAAATRSQLDNRRACLRRLRKLVGDALTPPRPRKPTRPSRVAVEKRLATKRRRSQRKEGRRAPDADR